jgi:hypothetical protein
MTPYLTSVALGLVIGLAILWLVRRDQLHGSFAVWWILIALASLVIGFFPQLIDQAGARFGIAYPPMLLVLVALAVILIKLVSVDIDVTRRERRLRRLLQKVAILELELRQIKARIDATDRSQADVRTSAATRDADATTPNR